MKRILLLFIFMLSIKGVIVCQNGQVEYRIQKEYREDSDGNKIIPIENPEYSRIYAKDNSSWGFINKFGDIVIPLGKYKFLNPIDEEGMILAHKDNKEGFIDINENILIPFVYDDVGVFSKSLEVNLAPVIKDGKQGFINRKGELIIPLEYDSKSRVSYFNEQGFAILLKDGNFGVIDTQNNIVIPFEYEEIELSACKDCFIVTNDEEEWATFSFDGNQLSDFNNHLIIVDPPLGSLPTDSHNLPILVTTEENQDLRYSLFSNLEYLHGSKQFRDSIEAAIGGEYAYIDKFKHVIVPFGVYDDAEPFGLGRKAIVSHKGMYGIIDEYGNHILPLEYDFIERPSRYSYYADILVATRGEGVTIFDKNVDAIQIEGITSYIDGDIELFVSNKYGKKGCVSYKGKLTIPFEYDTLYYFRNSELIARKEGRYGYISRKNEIIRPFEYKSIYGLKGDLVFVNMEDKAGIYKEDQVKIPFEYEAIYDTYYNDLSSHEDRYIVIKGGKVGTIDNHNNVIIPIIYEGLSGWVEYGPEAHFAKKNGKYGLISHEGEVIIPIDYEYVGLPHEGIVIVRKNGKYGVVSWGNKEILPCIYDTLIGDVDFFGMEDNYPSRLVALQNNIWRYFDTEGKLIRENVPEEEIMKKYDYMLEWGEPSNEEGFDLIQAKF